jgi:hypothetical protein
VFEGVHYITEQSPSASQGARNKGEKTYDNRWNKTMMATLCFLRGLLQRPSEQKRLRRGAGASVLPSGPRYLRRKPRQQLRCSVTLATPSKTVLRRKNRGSKA